MNGLTGLDGRSLLIGGGLVLAGMVTARAGGLFPLLLIGGIVYLIGSRKGWWGHRGAQPGSGHELAKRGPGGPPGFFAEWHRQAHAADGTPVPAAPAAYAAHPAPPAPPAWRPATPPAPQPHPQPQPQAPHWQPAPPPAYQPAPPAAPVAYADQHQPAPAPTTAPAPQPAAAPAAEVHVPVNGATPQATPEATSPEAEYRRTVGDATAPTTTV